MIVLRRYAKWWSAIFHQWLIGLTWLTLSAAIAPAQVAGWDGTDLGVEAVYQGAQASDAFSAIRYLGNGRIIAGKRSSTASNRFLLSVDYGETWQTVGCPNSTGAHTYFFGQNGNLVFSGTGDTGSACLMKSTDAGSTWSVALSASQINTLVGSSSAKAVFSPVYLGANRWMANIKSFDTTKKVIMSANNGATWYVPSAQPGQNAAMWARQMILTSDNVLLWPSCQTDQMYISTNQGGSWSSVTVPGASLFQPLCDAGNGVYLCGEVCTTANTPIRLYRSLDHGQSWAEVLSVNLQRSTMTYWRDVIRVGGCLLASACCLEGTSNDRNMRLYLSKDDGTTWTSLGNPYYGPYGGMQAIYQMCATESNVVFAACQPDSTILKWPMPLDGDFNLDGVVDNLDKAIWYAHAFTGTTWAQGDANGDGVVNGLDRDILTANFGRSIFTEYPAPGPKLGPSPAPLPGPSTPTPNPGPTPGPQPVSPSAPQPGPLLAPKNPTPVGAAAGSSVAKSNAALPTGSIATPAQTAAVQAAVAITRSGNSAGAALSGVQQTPSPSSSMLYVGAGPGTPPISCAPPTAAAQTQSASIAAAQAKPAPTSNDTKKSPDPVASAGLSADALLTAHDAVFSQIGNRSSGITDTLFADTKAGLMRT